MWRTLARIEENQAELSQKITELQAGLGHENTMLRADLAMITSRINSRQTDTKKKSIESPNLSRHLLPGYSN